ncbi:MAG: 2-C-methyl-D-erythritol 2,4-cyclodiphosphate synthase [Bacteroidota bacterium]
MLNIRVGFGYDTHRLVEGRPLIIGGLEISHPTGLLGHSDADVLLHAICDALLGAANLRDIGFHFPDTDPEWKGVDSRKLLAGTVTLLHEKGYRVGNVDCTIVAEAPKMNPHIPAMCAVIAPLLQVDLDCVSLKATRNEGMDAIGRREGIKVHAVALIYRSDD